MTRMQQRPVEDGTLREVRASSYPGPSVLAGVAVGSPPPSREDVSGSDNTSLPRRDSISDSDDEYSDLHTNLDSNAASQSSQMIRCYSCETMSDFMPGGALQVFNVIPVTF